MRQILRRFCKLVGRRGIPSLQKPLEPLGEVEHDLGRDESSAACDHHVNRGFDSHPSLEQDFGLARSSEDRPLLTRSRSDSARAEWLAETSDWYPKIWRIDVDDVTHRSDTRSMAV